MKKLLIACIAVIFSCSAMAQNTKTDTMRKMSDTTTNGVVKIDGKMMTMMNGQTMPMTQSMTMSDGTIVMTDGTVKWKNGKTTMLKEGYCVKMDGQVEKMPMKKGM
ncbi:DUF6799 domain-containing protein [Mucilaginibacter sp.]|uniref:DUF6799 domain-containing protein n=1 Tax=Mucilaginibacter sp. TaxID=1882438 RepID=UPI002603BE19|nr:DUF6799 domain-containing protein [Mucilaginibacter sp.]MDB4925134.1 hypothetical protein [Mucilaginibacter sp.]